MGKVDLGSYFCEKDDRYLKKGYTSLLNSSLHLKNQVGLLRSSRLFLNTEHSS